MLLKERFFTFIIYRVRGLLNWTIWCSTGGGPNFSSPFCEKTLYCKAFHSVQMHSTKRSEDLLNVSVLETGEIKLGGENRVDIYNILKIFVFKCK